MTTNQNDNQDTTQDTTQALFVRYLRRGDASPNALLKTLTRMRAGADGNGDGEALDRLLLDEFRRLHGCCSRMQESQDKLRQMIDEILAPPWFPALFLGLVQAGGSRLARVRLNGAQRLVTVADEVDADALHRGDEVYLSEKQNLLVFKATGGMLDDGGVATVERLLPDGRLCVNEREAEYVVNGTPALMADPPAIGDRVRWFESAMLAVEKLPDHDAARPFLTEEIGDTAPQLFGGMNRERDRVIDRYVKHIAHPDIAGQYGVADGNRRLLMEGPPGCGKTLLARVLASAIKTETGRPVRLAVVAGSALYDPYVGQTERNIAALFDVPAGFDGTSMIFLDELDAIGRSRGGVGNVHGDRFLGTLLAKLEGYEQDRNVVVVAATNRAEMLDAALLERFAYRLEVSRPNRAAAREIFRIHLANDLPVRPNGDAREATVATMVETAVALLYDENAGNQVARLQFRDGKTRSVHARELLSGRLIEQVALAARQRGFERHVAGGEPGLTVEDVQLAARDAIARLGGTLSVGNVHSHLADLGAATDVTRVEPLVRRVRPERYLQ